MMPTAIPVSRRDELTGVQTTDMLSIGRGIYTWNARNQLASMDAGIDTFQYAQFAPRVGLRDDPFGHRVAKTISGATTNYFYDGLNPVQKLSGGSATANPLSGLDLPPFSAQPVIRH